MEDRKGNGFSFTFRMWRINGLNRREARKEFGQAARCNAIKKRAEPAFTSAEVRHASKSCSRGRFYTISYTLKKAGQSPLQTVDKKLFSPAGGE